jgi:hypothetical protein
MILKALMASLKSNISAMSPPCLFLFRCHHLVKISNNEPVGVLPKHPPRDTPEVVSL